MVTRDQRKKARREKLAPIPEPIARRNIWFRSDEVAALQVRAARENRSETAVIREAVRRLLGLEEPRARG
jgi:Ribbon-helix-helix protein, copG family